MDIRYDYNANTVYFDGIQLYKEEFGSSYTYDDKGNVVSVVDLQKQTTSYEYDTGSNVTRILENNQAKVTYTYDDYHNVKTATTQEGLVYSFEYDAYGNSTYVSIPTEDYFMTSYAEYSLDGNNLISFTDTAGKVTQYSYNEDTNVLEWVKYPEDTAATRTNYSYDSMYRLASAAVTTDTGTALSASYTYTDDLLTAIQTPITTYSLAYGDFAQRSSVKIGSRTLASYTYTNDRNRYLSALDYGNGDRVQYTYDSHGRLISETYEGGDTVTYAYDNNGSLATVTDSATGITTTYYYDFTDRLMRYTETGNGYSHSVSYEYDSRNNLASMVEDINGEKVTTTYTYDEDNRISSVTNGTTTRTYTYTDFGKVEQIITKNGDATVLNEYYDYVSSADHASYDSGQVSHHYINADPYLATYSYTYDDNGNITSISTGSTAYYTYDSANQLIREENECSSPVYIASWSYDDAGNIQSRTEYDYYSDDPNTPTDTVTYTYGDSEWGDLLTGYDGKTITSDAIGNMRSDGTWTYSWEHGRQLAAMSDGSSPIEISVHPEDYRGAIGDTATFTVAAEGDGLTYQWQYSSNGGSSWWNLSTGGYNTPTLSIQLTEARIGFLYRCSIQDVNGNQIYSNSGELCLDSVQQVVILEHPQDFVGNIGDMASFTVSARGENLTYQWQYSVAQTRWRDSTATGSATPTVSLRLTAARVGNRYRCVVTDAAGNTSISTPAALSQTPGAISISSHPEDYRGREIL